MAESITGFTVTLNMSVNICPIEPGSIVGGYFRDSGGPEQEKSVDQQLAEARRYCERHQLRFDESLVFIDRARSGKNTDERDDFFRMIAALDKKPRPCDGMLLWSSARFARNQLDSQYYKAMLRRQGYTLIFLSGDVPDAGPLTPIFEAAVDWKNEQYLTDMRREIKRGIHWVQGEGAFVGGTPTGFKRIKTSLGVKRNGKPRLVSKLEVDEALTPLIRQAFEMRAKGCTLMEIHEATGLFHCKQPAYNYSRMLRNPIYIGRFGAIENYVTPIVSLEIWERAQEVSRQACEQKGVYHRRRSAGDLYCLSGLARCAYCGDGMYIHTVRGRWRGVKKEREYLYRYYDCCNKRYGTCPDGLRVYASRIERAVLAQVEEDCLSDAGMARLNERMAERRGQAAESREAQSASHKTKLAQIEREVNNLAQSAASAPLSKALAQLLEEREAEAERLRAKIADILSAPVTKRAFDLQVATEEIRAAIDSGEPRRLRRALAALIDFVEVKRNEVTVHYLAEVGG